MKKNIKTQERLNVGEHFKEIPLRCDTTVPLKSQKGITLIALVITIVVLLILAGVTLSIVFNGGIINKSQNAVDKYSHAQQNETEILDYIDKQFGLQMPGLDNINGNDNKKVIESATTGQYYNPVIPVGFKTVNTETASWEVVEDATLGKVIKGWDDGLVIEDKDGNQFVWVPVDGTKVTYGYHYNIGSQGSTSLEQSLPTGITSENTQITKYGGFYIARYEAGIPSNLTIALTTASNTARNVSGTPVSKKNQVPWNYISWSQSKANAASMYTLANTNNKVQSGLITDRMWETTMQWLANANPSVNVTSDSREWGNYTNAPVNGITEYSTNYGASWIQKTDSSAKGTNTSWLLKTGHTDYTNRKNIYDLAGNLWEWTNAKYSSSSYYVGRGGYYDDYGTAYVAARRGYTSDSGNLRGRF